VAARAPLSGRDGLYLSTISAIAWKMARPLHSGTFLSLLPGRRLEAAEGSIEKGPGAGFRVVATIDTSMLDSASAIS